LRNNIIKGAERYQKAHRRKTIWYRVLSVLSAITVFCTTYALILPAITLEDPAPGIKLNNVYVYEDSDILINFHVSGRATFEKESLDSGNSSAQKVELSVERIPESDYAYNEYYNYMESSLENDTLYTLNAFELTFTYEGARLNTKNCTVVAEISPKDSIKDVINEKPLIDVDSVSENGLIGNTVNRTMLLSSSGPVRTSLLSTSDESNDNNDNKEGKEDKAENNDFIAFSALQGIGNDISEQDTVYIGTNTVDDIPMLTTAIAGDTIAFATYSTANPSFTVQYYTSLSVFDTYTKAEYNNMTAAQKAMCLPLIDTSGGKLPTNTTTTTSTNDVIYVKLNANGTTNLNGLPEYTLAKHTQLMPIYTEKTFEYVKSPDIMYFDKLYDNGNFTLSKILVLKNGADPNSNSASDWTEYPADATFTNNASSAIAGKRIFIEDGAVIRLIYTPNTGDYTNSATFFDYDITDGYIYTSANAASGDRRNTSAQTNNGTWYAKTNAFGINKFTAASGTAKFAFGNSNTGVAAQADTLNGAYINQYNKTVPVYLGCSFGLVTGLSSDGLPIFAKGISAPDLFSTKAANGKTIFNNYSLQFIQQGDTYTLAYVNGAGTSADNLHLFSNPQSKYSHIFTNNFWPMDSAKTWGADGHDIKFGSETYKSNRKRVSDLGTGDFPASDDAIDHNSYFGMTYSLEFEISEDYEGPLEYIFYGDDDMWVFLDGKLVCDIGGVHSSVGEYVNLWDYIDKGTAGKHTLSFFYTERGASGSTCYMQFTLPSVSIQSSQYETTSLHVEKEVQNSDTTQSFDFDITFTDANGAELINTYAYTVYNADNSIAGNGIIENSTTSFKLSHGQYIVVDYLPIGAKYVVKETAAPGFFTVNSINGGTNTESNIASGTLDKDRENIHFINITSAKLPSTGGRGIVLFFVPLAVAVLYSISLPLIRRKVLSKKQE